MPSYIARLCAVVGALLAIGLPAEPVAAQAASSLTLAEALRRAEAGSPQIAAAEAAVRAAEGRARQAGLSPNPEARVEIENAWGSGPYAGLDSAEATLAIAQTLELGGKRSARARAGAADVALTRTQLQIAHADVAQAVRECFADLVAARERLDLAEAAVVRSAELARVAAKLVEEGREPPLRAYRALTAAGEAAATRDAARAELGAAQRALAVLIGEPDGAVLAVAPAELAVPIATAIDPVETLDVKAAELELDSARARVDVERAGRVPDLTIEGGVRQFRDTDDTAVVAGVSMPIPVRNRNQGAVAAANADAAAAEARRNLALARANQRIRDARAGLDAADARLKTLRQFSLPQAEEAVRLARLGYAEGEFSLLEVLDAEDSLSQARTGLIEAEQSRAKALAALERAAAR